MSIWQPGQFCMAARSSGDDADGHGQDHEHGERHDGQLDSSVQ
jgi:hypothetical protein